MSGLPVQSLNARNAAMYGLSLAEVGNDSEAERWLEWALDRRPSERVMRSLLNVYRRQDKTKEVRRICEAHRKNPNLEKLVKEECPEPKPANQQMMEQLEKKYRERKSQ